MDHGLPVSSWNWTNWDLGPFSNIYGDVFGHDRVLGHPGFRMFPPTLENGPRLDSEISNFFQSSVQDTVGELSSQ